jgi:hypothetical protein
MKGGGHIPNWNATPKHSTRSRSAKSLGTFPPSPSQPRKILFLSLFPTSGATKTTSAAGNRARTESICQRKAHHDKPKDKRISTGLAIWHCLHAIVPLHEHVLQSMVQNKGGRRTSR